MGDLIRKARAICRTAYCSAVDKVGVPYYEHPETVATLGGLFPPQSEEEIAVRLLHDVVEDTKLMSIDDMHRIFGSIVANAVDALTHRRGESNKEYLERVVLGGAIAIRSKLMDIRHNLDPERLAAITDTAQQDRLRAKYTKAWEFLLSYYRPFTYDKVHDEYTLSYLSGDDHTCLWWVHYRCRPERVEGRLMFREYTDFALASAVWKYVIARDVRDTISTIYPFTYDNILNYFDKHGDCFGKEDPYGR